MTDENRHLIEYADSTTSCDIGMLSTPVNDAHHQRKEIIAKTDRFDT
jgi:hypothetical protein